MRKQSVKSNNAPGKKPYNSLRKDNSSTKKAASKNLKDDPTTEKKNSKQSPDPSKKHAGYGSQETERAPGAGQSYSTADDMHLLTQHTQQNQ